MPQYERKTGYVVRRMPSYCFIAETYDKDAAEQFFAHAKAFKDMKVPHMGAQVAGVIKRTKVQGQRDTMFDIEVLSSRPLEAA